jgi:hypothetical protein
LVQADDGEGDVNDGTIAIAPVTFRDAARFVSNYHRHHKPPAGAIFCVGLRHGIALAGVAIVGRPVARGLQDGWTCEVTRCCTDGTRNGCSMLYGACRRAAFALGYRRVVTYTLPHEGGASLRAAGFVLAGLTDGGEWSCPSRERQAVLWPEPKWRWEIVSGETVADRKEV